MDSHPGLQAIIDKCRANNQVQLAWVIVIQWQWSSPCRSLQVATVPPARRVDPPHLAAAVPRALQVDPATLGPRHPPLLHQACLARSSVASPAHARHHLKG